MNALLKLDAAMLTMASPDLLEFVNEARAEFGESLVRHNDFVTRCKDELDGEPYETFVEPPQITATGRIPAFEAIRMTPDQCKLVAMRESKGVRRRVLARLNALEAQRVASPFVLPDFTSPAAAARAWADAIEATQAIAIERDHAIKTKAQIGSKREATAMATAASAKREAAKLKDQLGCNEKHATVKAVHGATGMTYAWLPLRRWCKAFDQSPKNVVDPLYGAVKAWPADAWAEVHGVDLAELFGEVTA